MDELQAEKVLAQLTHSRDQLSHLKLDHVHLHVGHHIRHHVGHHNVLARLKIVFTQHGDDDTGLGFPATLSYLMLTGLRSFPL